MNYKRLTKEELIVEIENRNEQIDNLKIKLSDHEIDAEDLKNSKKEIFKIKKENERLKTKVVELEQNIGNKIDIEVQKTKDNLKATVDALNKKHQDEINKIDENNKNVLAHINTRLKTMSEDAQFYDNMLKEKNKQLDELWDILEGTLNSINQTLIFSKNNSNYFKNKVLSSQKLSPSQQQMANKNGGNK